MNESQLEPARIGIIDDHGIVRFGYAQLIESELTLEVCGLASDEQEGLELLKRETPDLAIVDLSLAGGDGLNLIDSAVKLVPDTKLLVISAHHESLFAHRVLAAGAVGFINKQEAPERLIEGIHAVLDGEFYFSEHVTKDLIRRRLGGGSSTAPKSRIESLTNRELQVFEQVGHGQSTREIADFLILSVKTIERHKENIKQKLQIQHATQLVQHATPWVLTRNQSVQCELQSAGFESRIG